jgi:hypothetical protein
MADSEKLEYEGSVDILEMKWEVQTCEVKVLTIGDYHVDTVWRVVEKTEESGGLIDLVLSPDGIEDPGADTLVEMVSDGLVHIRYLYGGEEWLQGYRFSLHNYNDDLVVPDVVELPTGHKRMTLVRRNEDGTAAIG